MGGSSYSDDDYSARIRHRAATGKATFDHDSDIKRGVVAAKLHDTLDIKGKVRESRDSDAHPESNAIAVIFDHTGSMGGIPRRLQEKIPQLMGLLLRKDYIKDPQILFGAVGDFHADHASLQVGQFESGIEMDDNITKLWLEGGGGGTNQESYELALYYFAHRTSIDCLEKRGKKGYLFIIGDEDPYPRVSAHQLEAVMGVAAQHDIETEKAVEDAKEKYNVFFIIPKGAANSDAKWLVDRWSGLLGAQHVIKLDNPDAVCETIATTIGVCEGTVDSTDRIGKDLKDVGADARVVGTVKSALDPLVKSTALARAGSGSGNLPEVAAKPSTNVRL